LAEVRNDVFSPQDSASSLTVPQNERQSSRLALLPIPVIALVLAFTAVPTELRSLSHHRIRDFFGIRFDDFVANLAGYVPVGAVLANLGTGTAIGLASSVSVLAETMQLFSEGRSSQLTDVATNVIGAALGVVLCSRLRIDLSRIVAGKRAAAFAGVLAAVYVGFGTAISPQDVTNAIATVAAVPPWRQVNSRGATAPGRLEARWTFDAETGRISDASANQLSGVLVNQPPLVTGVAGRAIGLDGESQWIEFGDPVSLRLGEHDEQRVDQAELFSPRRRGHRFQLSPMYWVISLIRRSMKEHGRLASNSLTPLVVSWPGTARRRSRRTSGITSPVSTTLRPEH
jgi:VanZ like family